MLDDDQDMADMYLGRRQEAESQHKAEQSVRQQIEPPSPSHSAESMDELEPADFMGQVDTDSESEPPARPTHDTSPFITRSTPTKQAQPPPKVTLKRTLSFAGVVMHVASRSRVEAGKDVENTFSDPDEIVGM